MQELNIEYRDTDLELASPATLSFPIFIPKRKVGDIKINSKLDVICS